MLRKRTMQRRRLPDRRGAELIDFMHAGQKWTASIGRFKTGELAEVFLSGPKLSALVEMAAESAIVCSICLQAGVRADVLQHELRGRDIGPLARALELATEPRSA
jgi:hypothetical protein